MGNTEDYLHEDDGVEVIEPIQYVPKKDEKIPFIRGEQLNHVIEAFFRSYETTFDVNKSLRFVGMSRAQFGKLRQKNEKFRERLKHLTDTILNDAEAKILELVREPWWVINEETGLKEKNPLSEYIYKASNMVLNSRRAVSLGWQNSGTTLRVEGAEERPKPIQIEVVKQITEAPPQ